MLACEDIDPDTAPPRFRLAIGHFSVENDFELECGRVQLHPPEATWGYVEVLQKTLRRVPDARRWSVRRIRGETFRQAVIPVRASPVDNPRFGRILSASPDEEWPAARYGSLEYESADFDATIGDDPREWHAYFTASCEEPACWSVESASRRRRAPRPLGSAR
ncbi:MAG: hypothetical protein H6719_36530 [Sandaracinaceae bacterium]|nr:hypothetical protein [Sandaracinaceae bacterium]